MNDVLRREVLQDRFDNLCPHIECKKCRWYSIVDSFHKCALIDNAPTVEYPEEITIKCDTEDEQKVLSALRNARLEVRVEEERPQGEQKCVTCKYRGCGFMEKPCRECSRSYANLYEEAENETDN